MGAVLDAKISVNEDLGSIHLSMLNMRLPNGEVL